MSHRKGFPRLVKPVVPFTPDHPVSNSISRGSQWFSAWVMQMTTPYEKIRRKTGIPTERLAQFSRDAEPNDQEVDALAALWFVTPDGLRQSIAQWRAVPARSLAAAASIQNQIPVVPGSG